MILAIMKLGVTVLCGLLLVLLLLWFWFQVTYRALIKTASSLPSLHKTLPILGHAHHAVLGLEAFTQEAFQWLYEAIMNEVYTFCFWCGPLPIIIVSSAEDIQKVLNSSSTLDKSKEYDYMRFVSKDGLLTAPGSVWKITRRQLNPLFHPRSIEQLMPVFNRNSSEMVSRLIEHVGQDPVNVFDYTMDTALQTVCNFIYGPEMEINIEKQEFIDLKSSVQSFILTEDVDSAATELLPEMVIERVVKFWLKSDSWFNFFYSKELLQIEKSWQKFTNKALKRKQTGDSSEPLPFEVKKQQSKTDFGGFLKFYQALQENFPSFTDEDFWSEIATLYATGTDTIGLASASYLLLLAYHQDIQERLYQEITSVVGTSNDITVQDINKMTYLDQVYKETLRWSLIVPFVARRTSTDLQLSSCKIPAGNTVALNLAGLHWNPKTYPDPKIFNPEHFAQNSSENSERCTFLPFSGGPRNCVAKFYAELLIKSQVIHVMKNFKLTTKMNIYNMKRKYSITLVCTEGYNIQLHTRDSGLK